MELQEKIDELRRRAQATPAIGEPAIRNRLLEEVRRLFQDLAKLPKEQKGEFGKRLNALKAEVEELSTRAAGERQVAEVRFEDTLPGTPRELGRRHPIYRAWDEIARVFLKLGFEVEYGPEIETEENNFQSLNIPLEHPSRDAFDTFYVRAPHLLRSHTSPVQIRAMRRRRPPFRIIAPGKVFRPDDADASHLPSFHQVEGLMVGEDVSFAQLKGVLLLFAREMFGPDTRVRFRPSFFPFTEPSAEVDISCFLCGAKGCPACKGSGWMEILGSGMVHPKVFEAVGYDPEKVTGFAFGMGVERICMLRHNVRDIRWFVENNFRFLRQF
ncbi:MAG: phenylalanine--tRNA ligase subunit alpha [Planctomycetes bacterium]|nr:phenylalanine--tRNA ligase subunit alpha [Planctomycetota bacterium]